eukprot:s4546_g1.t2
MQNGRREGQGHRHSRLAEEPGEILKLILPECVPGGRDRFDRLPLNLQQCRLSDLRWAVQSVSGLSPARMRLLLDGETDLSTADESSTLSNLGFEDGSTLVVEQSAADAALRDVDMPVDIPSTGCADAVYETAATMLGLPDSSKLSLFAGSELINRNADLSLAPIADGVILSAYINSPLQLPVHVLPSGVPNDLDLPGQVAVRSCDTVADVRQRLLGSASSEMRAETETCLDGSLAFAVESGLWEREGGDCQSLASLEALLGHFTQCLETARLSRLGMADGGCHMVFVTRRILSVEVQVHQGDEWKCICPLRVPSTMRLSELSATLIRTLRHSGQLADLSLSEFAQCSWRPWSPEEARSSSSQSFAGGVAAVISKVKRKSLGSPEASPEKRARRSYSNVSNVQDLDDAMFLGDLLAQHPEPQNRYQQFLCPISMDIMLDPVVVGGSGNTYDRKSIEKHFQHCHRDPLNNMELRRPIDRRLIPNNQLRSQIREAEISRVQLRLSAHLAEQRSFSSDAPMAAYLGWPHIVVFLNKMDMVEDMELVDLVELEEGSGWVRSALPTKRYACPALCTQERQQDLPSGAEHATVFCQKQTGSQQYLSVAQNNRGVQVVMTQQPASLFVTHLREERSKTQSTGSQTMGFEHEGLPACGSFLRAHERFLEFFTSDVWCELTCEGSRKDDSNEFIWHPDATLQHVSSGRWLYVDPYEPSVVMLHNSCKSDANGLSAEEEPEGAVREMLDMYQFPGDDTPFIKGSALKALNGETGDYGVPAIKQLMEAVDSHFPNPERDVDKPFLMGIESVMSITGKGTVATGRIERGIAKTGDTIEIVGVKDKPMKATIAGIEMFHKTLDEGQSGDQCGVMLKGVKRNEIQRGQVLCAQSTVKTYSKFDADIYVLKEDEGGRKKPFFSSYRPQAFIRTATVTVEVQLPDSVEMAMPGDSLSISLNTEKPMALEEGLRFALREGGLTVGSGIITKCH